MDLFHDKMGLSIYLYHLAKIESNADCHSKAEQLLDQILLKDLSIHQSIAVEDGLAGVGLGMTWLVKSRLVEMEIVMTHPICYAIITLSTVIWNF